MGLFDIVKASDDVDQQEYAKTLQRMIPRLRRICLGANNPRR